MWSSSSFFFPLKEPSLEPIGRSRWKLARSTQGEEEEACLLLQVPRARSSHSSRVTSLALLLREETKMEKDMALEHE